MPVDPAMLRRIVDHNERVVEGIRGMSAKLLKLSGSKVAEVSATAAVWAENVYEVQRSLAGQQEVSRAMRESARIQHGQQSELFRDRYRFLLERLKSEVRALFHAMRDTVELPQDFQRQQTWNDCLYDLEVDLKALTAMSAGEHSLTSVDAVAALLNYQERLITHTLRGLLFQKAVLDWDLKNEREFADADSVEMAEKVVVFFSKNESVPARLRLAELPKITDPGPFTVGYKGRGEEDNELTPVQSSLLTCLRELQSLDKGLRHMKFAEKVTVDARDKLTGNSPLAEDLKKELQQWSDQSGKLQAHLTNSRKSKGLGGMELQAEQLLAKVSERDQTIKQQITRAHKLEGDVQSLKHELINLRREKNELQEKNTRMAKENLPVLEKMKHLLGKSQEAMERLGADTAVLSELFRLRVQENNNITKESDAIAAELAVVSKQVRLERQKKKEKEDEVRRKESLYLRTMAARNSIQESCLEQKATIANIEERIRQRQDDIAVMEEALNSKASVGVVLKDEMGRAKRRFDELQAQLGACQDAFERETGKPGATLLAGSARRLAK